MPKTVGAHFLMHSVGSAENNPHREVDSFDEAKKHREETKDKEPELNPEQKSNHKIAKGHAKKQQGALDKAKEAAQKEQEKQGAIVEKEKEQRGENEEQQDKKQDDDAQQQKQRQQQGEQETKGKQGGDQGKPQQKQVDKTDTKGKDQDSGKQDKKQEQQGKAEDKQQQGKADDKQQKQEGKQDDKQQQRQQGKQEEKSQPDKKPQDSMAADKQDKDTKREEGIQRKKEQEEQDGKQKQKPDDSKGSKSQDSAENSQGRRDIEARRVPEDVEEGRPSPSNEGRSLLLPRHEMTGNWEDIERRRLSDQVGSDEHLAPQPTAPGKYGQAIEENNDQTKRHGIIRQQDLEKKQDEMGEPGRATKMSHVFQHQEARETDTPEQKAESAQKREKEAAGDNKSPADKMAKDGWREATQPGKYMQSKEGKEKAQEAPEKKKLTPQEEKKARIERAQQQHVGFYEELARRRNGQSPMEQLDSVNYVDRAAERHQREEQEQNLSDFDRARMRLREEEQDWRERQQRGLNQIQDLQRMQEAEIAEGDYRRQYREQQRRFRDDDEGVMGSFKHFASDKWHDLTHSKDEGRQGDQFWDRDEQQNRGLKQRRTMPPTSPITPTSGRRALGDMNTQQRSMLENEQPAKRGWWIFRGLQPFAPQWNGKENGRTRFIDTLSDDELSMMSL